MKKLNLSIFIIVILIYNLFSQNSGNQSKKISLDINTAVSLALANNLDIKSEKLKFDSAKWSAFTSWNTFVPRVTMSATLARSYAEDNLRFQFGPATTNISFGSTQFTMPEISTKALWALFAVFNMSLDINAVMVFKVYQSILDYKSGKINLDIAKNNVIQ